MEDDVFQNYPPNTYMLGKIASICTDGQEVKSVYVLV